LIRKVFLLCGLVLVAAVPSKAVVPTVVHAHHCTFSFGPGSQNPSVTEFDCWGVPTFAGNAVYFAVQFDPTGTQTGTVSDENSDTFILGPGLFDATGPNRANIYCGFPTTGSHKFKITFSSGNTIVGADVLEVNNISSCTADATGSAAAVGGTPTASSMTPTQTGDFFIQFTIIDNATGNTSWTAGSQANITWTKAESEILLSYMTQTGQYTSTAAISPSLSVAPSTARTVTVAGAYKTGTAGTAAPTTGADVCNFADVGTRSTNTSSDQIEFPVPAGCNLIIILDSEADTGKISSIASTNPSGLTWDHRGETNLSPQHSGLWCAVDSSPSPNMTITFTYAGSGNSRAMQVYAARNMAATGTDCKPDLTFGGASTGYAGASGTQSVTGDLTTVTATPGTVGDLIVGVVSLQFNSATDIVTPATDNYVQCHFNPGYVVPTTCGENDPWTEGTNTTLAARTYTFHQDNNQQTGVGKWAASFGAFLAAPSTPPGSIFSGPTLVTGPTVRF
jgi:hypothetical protein